MVNSFLDIIQNLMIVVSRVIFIGHYQIQLTGVHAEVSQDAQAGQCVIL